MSKHVKLLLTALTAAIVLGGVVGTASARRFETSNQLIRVVWSSLRFANSAAAEASQEVRCPVTLEGSFHSKTISKVCGQLVGLISRAALTRSACTFRSITEVEILPPSATRVWRILYVSFTGTLPIIRTIRVKLIAASFRLGVSGIQCLFESTNTSPALGDIELNETTGAVTGLRAISTSPIPKHEGGILCPGSLIFEGTGTVTQLGNTTAITIKLVQ